MKCPQCKGNVEYEDDSFDHAFGTEIRRFYYCEDCEWQEDASEVESELKFTRKSE
jgi:transcriptional regulator NrdR family protein